MGRTGKHVIDTKISFVTIQDKVKQKPHQYKNGLKEISSHISHHSGKGKNLIATKTAYKKSDL
jgi:hypothetical protein